MDHCINHNDCSTCPERLVCHCLHITEADLVTAVTTLALRTVHEVRQHTGAGDGCNACHKMLRRYLDAIVAPQAVVVSAAG